MNWARLAAEARAGARRTELIALKADRLARIAEVAYEGGRSLPHGDYAASIRSARASLESARRALEVAESGAMLQAGRAVRPGAMRSGAWRREDLDELRRLTNTSMARALNSVYIPTPVAVAAGPLVRHGWLKLILPGGTDITAGAWFRITPAGWAALATGASALGIAIVKGR
jgi:hypothetical protein